MDFRKQIVFWCKNNSQNFSCHQKDNWEKTLSAVFSFDVIVFPTQCFHVVLESISIASIIAPSSSRVSVSGPVIGAYVVFFFTIYDTFSHNSISSYNFRATYMVRIGLRLLVWLLYLGLRFYCRRREADLSVLCRP